MTTPDYTNCLIYEKSPYLLQHANNPVNWLPWGDTAFSKAKAESKPIMLSIGYSTCHWCHVMEKESFENNEIAEILNKHFVPIKVDREERTDIDNLYMDFVVNTTGQGGWPLTIFLTPELKPFFGGTYFPAEDYNSLPGFKSILITVSEKWQTEKDEIINSADYILNQLKEIASPKNYGRNSSIDSSLLRKAFEKFNSTADKGNGGFGIAPKFPATHNLDFLLRYWGKNKNKEAAEIVDITLEKMGNGGIHDHIGGGFHRYSTDKSWHLPHFEKMLYDQAQISSIYLDASLALGKAKYAEVAKKSLRFITSKMKNREGGFCAAFDADSLPEWNSEKKLEGSYYLWKKNEIIDLLGEKANQFCDYFQVKDEGNVDEDPHNIFKRKNILHINEKVIQKHEEELYEEGIKDNLKKLEDYRSKRPEPVKDDKILTDWNSMAITSLCKGHRVLNNNDFKSSAENCYKFIKNNLIDKNNNLLHRYRDGEASYFGTLNDYSFYIEGLLNLYFSTLTPNYLIEAKFHTDKMLDLFSDENTEALFFTSKKNDLLYRQVTFFDGAIPSAYSKAILSLFILYKITLSQRYKKKVENMLSEIYDQVNNYPGGYAQYLIAMSTYLNCKKSVIIAGSQNETFFKESIRFMNKIYKPNVFYLPIDTSEKGINDLIEIAPWLKEYTMQKEAAAYVCENGVCSLPIKNLETFRNFFQNEK